MKFDYVIDSNELLGLKPRVISPPVTFNGFIICRWRGDLTYEISSLEVYPPNS